VLLHSAVFGFIKEKLGEVGRSINQSSSIKKRKDSPVSFFCDLLNSSNGGGSFSTSLSTEIQK